YKVNNLKLEIVPEEEKYILKSWECYVYLYTYPYKNIFFKALIFWLGRSASLLHRGKAAALTVDFVEKKKIDCVQMRVLEGSEQHEVLGMLGGGAVIQKNASKEGVFLYEVRNVRGVDYIRIVQVIDHTRDVNCTYILVKNDSALLMQSNTPNNTKKTQQIELIKRIGMNAGIFKELCEDTFTLNNLFNTSVPEHPHAFTLSACTGVIEYETLYELSVQTMDDNKVIVVTMKGGVYCWIKSEVTLQDTIKILRAVTEYIQCAEIKKEILVGYFVRPQHESEILRRVFFENQELNRETEQVEKIKDIFSQLTRSYTLDELKKKPKFLCSISFGQLEHFLSDADFNKAFKMSKEQFSSLPKWKQMNLKVKVGLW
ncbi:villidin, putative, partial [Entamoeba invadens IP1]